MKKVILQIIVLSLVHPLLAQDSTLICKNAVNATVTILTDSVCGSGFFIDDSIIATNYHVIKESTKIYYRTNNSSVKYGIAGYVAVDKTFDLILLKVSGLNKPPVTMATSQAIAGQKVFDVSGSNGLQSAISRGIINSKLGLNGDTLLQITAPIPNKGSGGPIVDSTGQLMGVSILHYVNGHYLYLAIPMKYVERLLKNRSDSPISLSELNSHANTPALAANAYFREGLQKFVYEDYKGDIQDFTNAVNLNPKDTDAYEFLGITRLLLNDYIGAITDFKRYLQLKPGSEDAYYLRGVTRRKIDDNTEAINDFDSVIILDPNNAEAYLNRGLAEVASKNYEDAEQDFVEAIDLNVNYSDNYIRSALVQEKIQNYKSAINYLTLCLSLNPNEFLAYLLRGYAKYMRENLTGGNASPSINDYRIGLINCTTHDVNVSFYCGLAKYKLGDYKIALQYFNKAITDDSRYTMAYFYRGLVNTILNNYPDAIKDYTNATLLNPNYAEAYFYHGVLKNKTSDYQGALKDFDQAIKLAPQNGKYYYYRAKAKLNSGDKDGECSDLNKAKELGDTEAVQVIQQNCK